MDLDILETEIVEQTQTLQEQGLELVEHARLIQDFTSLHGLQKEWEHFIKENSDAK